MAPVVPDQPIYPLYSTTFTVHRLSPLYLGGSQLERSALRQYASQFRDILAGDVLRGVRVGLATDEEGLARAGSLRSVQWHILPAEEEWTGGGDQSEMGEDTTMTHSRRGIYLEVKYEKAAYMAIMLCPPQDETDDLQLEESDFAQYPILLTRMPGPLRESFLDFLSTTFDTHASVLKLSHHFLSDSLEKYIADITTSDGVALEAVAAARVTRTVLRDILVTISFSIPDSSALLRTVDVTISRDDIWPIVARGRTIQNMNTKTDGRGPFMAALGYYLNEHLALDINHQYVGLSKIACGTFVIGADGRIKIFPPSTTANEETPQAKATSALVASLIEVARASVHTTK